MLVSSQHRGIATYTDHLTPSSTTRIYLHLADDWLASQYRKAAEVIDAQVFAAHPASAGATGGGR